jgi:hypothetical protein
MGEIYEVHHWDGLSCRDIHKDGFRHSEVDSRGYIDRQHFEFISLFFFKIRKIGLKCCDGFGVSYATTSKVHVTSDGSVATQRLSIPKQPN